MTEQQVETLIQKFADGSATEEELQQLENWYGSSPVTEVLWPAADASERKEVYNRMLQRLRRETGIKADVYRLSWVKVAAIFLLVVSVALLSYWYHQNADAYYITITNPSGKIATVHLPDGTKVWLNALTTLRYKKAFTQNRALALDGEAYFEVSHDADHPFRVRAGGLETTVLGTSFNIKAYGQDTVTRVSVLTGRVQVQTGSTLLAVLPPLMQLQFSRDHLLATTAKADTAALMAWKRGRLQFDGETLAGIAASLERWYGVQMQFTNDNMQRCRYYMSFDEHLPLTEILATIAEVNGMKYRINESEHTVVLSGKGCD